MSEILATRGIEFATEIDVLIIGAGACGLVSALRAAERGVEVCVLERDTSPSGSTSMSSGFIPAPGTRTQRAANIDDSSEQFIADLQHKAHGLAEPRLIELAARTIGPTLDWLQQHHGLDWVLLEDFLYPGHSRHRMHAVAEKTGTALLAKLLRATAQAEIPLLCNAYVSALYVDTETDQRIIGVRITRPDGTTETIGCRALVLACNGYGGNRALVAEYIPQMSDALYYGHAGNQGDALRWGQALGAALRDLSGCQGHGSVAHPHNILLTWALMSEGGIQVNRDGERFANEHQGYSEHALDVLAQPGGCAWAVFDQRLYEFGRDFPDFRAADDAGAIKYGEDIDALAVASGLPTTALAATLTAISDYASGATDDPLGRNFDPAKALQPPYRAVQVTGALFHTQGGLLIDDTARVLDNDGQPLANLFAGGGAACGVSGPELSGYLSGNGLLTAIAFGAIAGDGAADLVAKL